MCKRLHIHVAASSAAARGQGHAACMELAWEGVHENRRHRCVSHPARPPELTPRIAAARSKEINLMLHSLALISDEMDGARGVMPVLRASATLAGAVALSCINGTSNGLAPSDASLGFKGHCRKPPRKEPCRCAAAWPTANRARVGPRQEPLKRELSQLHAAASLSVPMTHQGLPWGALQLLRERPFLAEDAILLWLYTLVLEGVLPAPWD